MNEMGYAEGRHVREGRSNDEWSPAPLGQVDVLVSQGQNMVDAIRQIGVSDVTYYRWRQEFGGLKIEQVQPRAVAPRRVFCPRRDPPELAKMT
jgi:transposase-like protein